MKRLTIPKPVAVPGATRADNTALVLSLREAFDQFVAGQPMWRDPKVPLWNVFAALLDKLDPEAEEGSAVDLTDAEHEALQKGFTMEGKELGPPWAIPLTLLAGAVFSAEHVRGAAKPKLTVVKEPDK